MDRNLPPLSDELVAPFLELLQRLRAICDGDLEKNIILLAIAARSVADAEFAAMSNEARMQSTAPLLPSRGLNLRSIAESSGIPRETVRRKVGELIEAGWIGQSGRNLHFTAQGYAALTVGREGLEALAHQFHQVVQGRAARAAGAGGAPV
ncbi:hypothetical protein [Phenylobacterium deserti]|uniref:HTH iclR-type domain-containing protein n=1 Tax=Phenylobacterium deserti TaxID=1914756 RepID=A0A328ADS4_9CAUL|nr:hypothetical protein [Phenylobacterium deserti]RAK52799.1 hypothetical protein DJ018_11485 [Phenylobacterium deserti]